MPACASHRPGEPVPLRPAPDRLGFCPECNEPLAVQAVHLAGWRSLVRASCPRDHGRFLQDLPAGHGLLYPATLALDTGQTVAAPGSQWYSEPLQRYWEQPDADLVEIRVERRREVAQATVLNCLDVVYGHAVLKLLNASRELDAGHDVVLVLPSSLAHLAPTGIAELWTVAAGPGRLRSWLLDLEARIADELERFESVSLSPAFPHPHPSTYRLSDFVADVRPERRGEPSVVLSLRDDRRWGRTGRAQRQNVDDFCGHLRRRFPDIAFTAIGVGGEAPLPEQMSDQRSSEPTWKDEAGWLALAAGADLVVGVHGSNMLLPSGLAHSCVELVPRGRYGNVLQASVIDSHDPLEVLWRHRFVYGNASLSDVAGKRVAAIAAELLTGDERFEAVMLGPLAGRGGVPAAPVGASAPGPASLPLRLQRAARGTRRALDIAATGIRSRAAGAVGRMRARGLDAPRVMTDRRGVRFELVDQAEIEQFVVHGGHFEWREIDFLCAFAEPGDVVFDVGANIGAFSAPLARAVSPGGSVHAFEPVTVSRARLERTLELNGLDNVIVNPLAVGATGASVELVSYGPGYESWTSTVPRQIEVGRHTVGVVERTSVAATTLDDYSRENGIEHVTVVKIDVEGGEPDVLEGASGMLAANAVDLLLFELSDNTLPDGVRPHDVIDKVTRHGYRTYVLGDRGPVPFRSSGHLEFANVIAVAPAARERLASAQSRVKR